MSSARSRKKKSRSSVKLLPLYKHPQDAPPQFAVLSDKGRIKVPLRWELAYPYQVQHHRHTWNCAVQFNVRKIARVDMYLFCQRSARNSLCFPPCFYISSKGFKAGTVLDFSHITSPSNIL